MRYFTLLSALLYIGLVQCASTKHQKASSHSKKVTSHKASKKPGRLSAAPLSVVSGGVTYVGASTSLGQTYYRGIPYATPPVGQLRFAPPRPIKIQSGKTIDATNYGPICHAFTDTQTGQSEDCLFVDIQVPAGHKLSDRLPVMFWIYGGGFEQQKVLQDPSALLAQSTAMNTPIIFVAVNYRIGPYGFLGGSQAQKAGYTNVGILDQRMALQWVQTHIADFGGDPSKVTVVGQSAGAVSTSIHLFQSKALFRGAVMFSGTANTVGIGGPSLRQSSFNNLLKRTGCTGKKDIWGCMRSVDEVHFHRSFYSATKNQQYPWAPQVDGSVVPASPASLFQAGKFASIPILAGDVLDEGTSQQEPSINSTSQVTAYLSKMLPKVSSTSIASLVSKYSSDSSEGSPYNTGANTFNWGSQGKEAASIYGDVFFHSVRRQFMTAAANKGLAVYGYLFTQGTGSSNPMGVQHTSDLSTWFGRGRDSKLNAQAASYLINFINNLNPNGPNLPNWPSYGSSGNLLQVATGAMNTVPDNYRQSQIAYIINNAASFHH